MNVNKNASYFTFRQNRKMFLNRKISEHLDDCVLRENNANGKPEMTKEFAF